MGDPTTDRPRRWFSKVYASTSVRLDDAGMGALRDELLAPLAGAVVEIGCGNGRNFARYPATVTSVVAVEPEPHLRALAAAAATRAPVPVEVHAGVAERLPLADGTVDAAVLCLVACSLPDRAGAFREPRRVLRSGGTVRFLEHTVADTPGLRRVQRIADATIWPLVAGGCHTATDPIGDLRAAGFTVDEPRRLRFPDIRITQPSTPHALGTAHSPD
ncbi:class I SAM-dependent methyltransferase [Pseudonocardia sp.]|uniref:class I SAM-dependent methyltransferase n=1 Tax=Pseudonocardia sp. TaxID=60912 RepID=UPI003D11A91C